MKALLIISVFAMGTLAGRANIPGNETEPKRAVDCAAFQASVEKRDYQAALAMLAGATFEGCESVDFVLARAKLKAATFEFKQAEQMLEALVNEHPDNSHVQQSWNHMLRLLDKSGEFTPIDVRPTRGSGTGFNFMIAWMNDTVPQLLNDALTDPVYFPFKTEGRGVMKFETEEDKKEKEFLDLVTKRLEDRRFEEIGPGVFLPDSSLVITAVKRLPYASTKNAERMALVQFDPKGKYCGELPVGDKKSNAAHPVFRSADSTLIFSSDRQGGFGGMDLWKTRYDGTNWSPAENLGPKINSSGDEILPTLAGDTLFYSSDRPYSGFGGLDIYAHRFSTGETKNLGLPVNGPYDEHSFYVTGEGSGLMVSNRGGNLDESALYTTVWTVPEDFFNVLTGKLKGAGDQTGREVHLLNEDGAILQKTVVDQYGHFSFKHIKGEEGYQVAMPDAELVDGSVLELYGDDDQLLMETTAKAGGFKFVLLATIDYTLEKMKVEDESLLAVDILGMYASDKEHKGMKIMLADSEGEVIATTFTGDDGRFRFESVRPDEKYTIKSEDLEANSLVHVVNEKGDLINTIDPSGEGEHAYVRLDPADGVITLTNEHNKRVRISNKDLFDLGVVNYAYNSTDIGREGVVVLAKLADILEKNPNVRVELEGHTDSRGPDAYNLRLSQERIESAMDYLELIGIERSRLSGTGYGELRPVNHCENGIECSEAEHAANRRTEFRLADRDD